MVEDFDSIPEITEIPETDLLATKMHDCFD